MSNIGLDTELPIVVIGAGPAGLTAAVELVRTGEPVLVLESDAEYVGGIARTARFGPFRVDIGGHRFFTRNEEVMAWWRRMLPDDFLVVERQSRIYFNQLFFDYPLQARDTLEKLGIGTSALCILSYLWRQACPVKPEKSFRDWVVNRFGDQLFHRFFESYTEKVWGMKCSEISADWAAQRIRGFSLKHAIVAAIGLDQLGDNAKIKTLTDKFHYPRLGCGMMWEVARDTILAAGGDVQMDRRVVEVHWRDTDHGRDVTRIDCANGAGEASQYPCRSAISSMALRDLIHAMRPAAPERVLAAAKKLRYRDFITVVLVIERDDMFTDQWIYIHDPNVKLGRVQNFRNWSAEMVPEPGVSVLGLEYFCFEGDGLWNASDAGLVRLGTDELEKTGLVRPGEVRDGMVIRVPKAYPIYDADYQQAVAAIREWLAGFRNLWSAGRNAMHQYNNQDHSMATALMAVRNLLGHDRRDPWHVDHEGEYAPRDVPKPVRVAIED